MHKICLLLFAATLLLPGCRDDGRIPTYPAGGTVKVSGGRPLAGGAILCESPHGLAARAVIEDDGTFRLGTYEQSDGAVEGKHRVAIRPPTPDDFDPDAAPAAPLLIDQRYLTMDTSGIEFNVTAAGPNQFQIDLEPPKGNRTR
jgi:hypothetical protein